MGQRAAPAALVKRDQRFAVTAMAQQVLREVQRTAGKPARTRHLTIIFQYRTRRAHVYAAEIGDGLPERGALIDGPAPQCRVIRRREAQRRSEARQIRGRDARRRGRPDRFVDRFHRVTSTSRAASPGRACLRVHGQAAR
jgi:hypothetical protein